MTAIGIVLMLLSMGIAFLNEDTETKVPAWLGDMAAFMFGTGLTLFVVGLVLWVWKAFP